MAFNLADVLKDVSASDTALEQIQYIPLTQLDEDPGNFYQLSDIPELADNIALCGLQQPIRVRQKEDGRYIIVSGHRRRAALEMLVADGYDYFSKAACIVERDEVSPTLQQLRLIYANANTRKMTDAEIGEQAAQVEKLLYRLKEEGFEFPGRMRDHVAQAVSQSKSKLARLKVIRENLDESWADAWKGGTLTEAQAYELAHMPKYWQSIIKDNWGTSVQSLYADRIRLFRDKFKKMAAIECQHGLQQCEHSSCLMRKIAKSGYGYYCDGCCFDCDSLQTCNDSCPEVAGKKKALRTVAKQAKQEAAEREAERVQPYADMARLVYERVGIARSRSNVSVEQLYKAQKRFYSHSADDKMQKDLERGVGTFNERTNLPFGFDVRPSLLIKIRDVADALQCSVDYLLGRTEDRQSHLSMPVEENPVSYPGTEWEIGDPTEAGRYILLVRYDADCPACLKDWEWDNDHGWQDESQLLDEDLVEVLGWIPMPKLPAKVHISSVSCITGMSPNGTCGAAAYCNKEYTCCLQCPEGCNSRCGWIDDVAEEI